MPISVSFHAMHVEFTATGDLTHVDFAGARATVRADPRFNASITLVMDLSLANDTSMTPDDMSALALARMFQSLAENRALDQIEIVRTRGEALALLEP